METASFTVGELSGKGVENFKISEVGDRHHGKKVLLFLDEESKGYVVKPRQGVGEQILADIEEYVLGEIGIKVTTNKPLLNSAQFSIYDYIKEEKINNNNLDTFFFLYGIKGAILFCLLATDIGNENVVVTNASGPVIIDAETILSPYKLELNLKKAKYDLNFDYCTLARTGFFPSNYIFSPLVSSKQIDCIKNSGAEGLTAVFEKYPVCDSYLENIFHGFRVGADVLQKSMRIIDDVLSMHEISELRVIIRPTRIYINNLLSPSDIDFNQEELNQMSKGDIPYFTYKSIGCSLNKIEILNAIGGMIRFCRKNKSFIERQIYEAGYGIN
jgi:lantibiotic modifying enzyme